MRGRRRRPSARRQGVGLRAQGLAQAVEGGHVGRLASSASGSSSASSRLTAVASGWLKQTNSRPPAFPGESPCLLHRHPGSPGSPAGPTISRQARGPMLVERASGGYRGLEEGRGAASTSRLTEPVRVAVGARKSLMVSVCGWRPRVPSPVHPSHAYSMALRVVWGSRGQRPSRTIVTSRAQEHIGEARDVSGRPGTAWPAARSRWSMARMWVRTRSCLFCSAWRILSSFLVQENQVSPLRAGVPDLVSMTRMRVEAKDQVGFAVVAGLRAVWLRDVADARERGEWCPRFGAAGVPAEGQARGRRGSDPRRGARRAHPGCRRFPVRVPSPVPPRPPPSRVLTRASRRA